MAEIGLKPRQRLLLFSKVWIATLTRRAIALESRKCSIEEDLRRVS